jgi:serine/alanine adding enzyme
MSISLLSEREAGEWDDFIRSHPRASLYHRAGWRPLVTRVFGHDAPYLVSRGTDGALNGILPLVHIRSRLFGSYVVSLPYFTYGGPLGGDAEVRDLMQAAGALAQERGARHVEFRCTAPVAGLAPGQERLDKVSMHLQLAPDQEKMWSKVSSQRRSQVRKGEKAGLQLHRGGLELLDDFYPVFARNMRDLGTPVYSRSFFAAMLSDFPQESLIVSVRYEGKPVAAAFLLQHPDRSMEVPWVSALREYNHLFVNTFLYWELLRCAIERGCTVFDFGRSTRDSGTFQFKKQWGAEPVQLHWNYWLAPGRALPGLTTSNPRFALAIAAWKRLPMLLANTLGPHLVKDLP